MFGPPAIGTLVGSAVGSTFESVAVLSPEAASRLQFGWTISVHILFATLSVGLAPFIVYLTYKRVYGEGERVAALQRFWVKVFALGFVMGTVTGIPMSFQFGTNFPIFSEFSGELIGGPLAFEAKMAFFLEAVFLGVLLFGRDRVGDRTYVLSSVLVGIGAWLSAFWILVVNAWMQTPRGFELVTENGQEVARLTDIVAAIATPRLGWMYVHVVNSAVIAVALVVAGVSAYVFWKKRDAVAWGALLRVAIVVLLVTAPLQVVHGDAYGRHVADSQPQKFAAMEAHYESGQADLHLIALPTDLSSFTDPRAENLWTVSLPGVGSFLASGGDFDAEVLGLNEYDQNPPVALVFWSFRAMVGLGFLFVALAFWGGYLIWRSRLHDSDRYLQTLMVASPLGFVALLTGWYVTEIGRQPWVVQDLLRTGEAVSPSLSGLEGTATLAAFVVIYLGLLAAFFTVCRLLIREELGRLGIVETDGSLVDRIPGVGSDD